MDVRSYRLQIRVIQLSALLAAIVMVVGLVNVWQGKTEVQATGDNVTANNTANTSGTGTGDTVLEGSETPANTKIVCLGDSFTIGYPGKNSDAWPQRVAEVLHIEVVNAGKVSQNTSDLLDRFEKDVVAAKPGTVVIFAGMGDALRGKTLEEYQNNIKALVAKAESNQIKPVLALPIPFRGTENLYTAYRAWEITYAQENKITMIDFTKVLFDSEGVILEKYSDDGKYPNKSGYAVMGDYAASELK